MVSGLAVHPFGSGVKGAGSKKSATGGEPAWLIPTAGGNHLSSVRVGQLSLCSRVLLLPHGVPPMPASGNASHKVFPLLLLLVVGGWVGGWVGGGGGGDR